MLSKSEIQKFVTPLNSAQKILCLRGTGPIFRRNLTEEQREKTLLRLADILQDDPDLEVQNAVTKTLRNIDGLNEPDHDFHQKNIDILLKYVDSDSFAVSEHAMQAIGYATAHSSNENRTAALRKLINKYNRTTADQKEDIADHISKMIHHWAKAGQTLPKSDQDRLYNFVKQAIQDTSTFGNEYILKKLFKYTGTLFETSPNLFDKFLNVFARIAKQQNVPDSVGATLNQEAIDVVLERFAEGASRVAEHIASYRESDPKAFERRITLFEDLAEELIGQENEYVKKKFAKNLPLIAHFLPESSEIWKEIESDLRALQSSHIDKALFEGYELRDLLRSTPAPTKPEAGQTLGS